MWYMPRLLMPPSEAHSSHTAFQYTTTQEGGNTHEKGTRFEPKTSCSNIASTRMDTLPADILLMIMLKLSSPRDLYSTIRSFRYCYQVFLTHKSLVLSTVIQLSIPPEVLPDALAACDASRIASLISQLNKLDRSTRTSKREFRAFEGSMRKNAMEFLRSYRLRRQRSVDDLSTTIRLCRLWAINEFLVTRYSEQAFKNMHHYLRAQESRKSGGCIGGVRATAALSETEHSRLQRAFFRFETYRKLFTRGMEDSCFYTPILNQREQSRLLQMLF